MFLPENRDTSWRDSAAAAAAAALLQSCPTLCDPTDGSPPGSSVPGILQARTVSTTKTTLPTRTGAARSVHSHSCTQSVRNTGFPGSSDSKESSCNLGHPGLIPGSGRSPGEGNGYHLQYSYLENSMNRGAWQATVHGATKSWTRLSD